MIKPEFNICIKHKIIKITILLIVMIVLFSSLSVASYFGFLGKHPLSVKNVLASLSGWVTAAGTEYVPFDSITDVSNNYGNSYRPSIALDASGNPCIAWHDNTSGDFEIYFARWDGSSWVNASGVKFYVGNGNVSRNPGNSISPFLALDSFGNPYISWSDDTSGNYEIYFAKWDGSSWVNDSGIILSETNGNVSKNSGISWYSPIALDSSGNPCITWSDDTRGNYTIYFARWNGSSWVNAQGTHLTNLNGNIIENFESSLYPSIDLDSSDNPCIAWCDNFLGNYEVYFSRWDGNSWVNAQGKNLTSENGNVSNNSDLSCLPSIKLDSSDNPCIAWQDHILDNNEIYFCRWNGISWTNVFDDILTPTNGNVSKSSADSQYPTLALDTSGYPYISWTENTPSNSEIYYVRWNSTSWVNAKGLNNSDNSGNVSCNSGISLGSSIILDSLGNSCIAWSDDTSGNYEIYFAKWDGSSWVNVTGAKLNCINDNVSSNYGDSSSQSLAIDSSGNPCITWSDNTSGNYEIYFARWDGSSWVNVTGAKLYTKNGNVSNTIGSSSSPSLALDSSDNPCISWCDNTTGNWDIYYIKWNGSSWVNTYGEPFLNTNCKVSNNSSDSWRPSLILDSSDYPCIAWEDYASGITDIYFTRWDGLSWINAQGTELSATNGNVIKSPGSSGNPSLILDSSGNPCIAWEDNSLGKYDIYFARWDGFSWINEQEAKLSENNYNISSNSGSSIEPSLAVDSLDNPCIAWEYNNLGNHVIYFAKWSGSSWINALGENLTTTNGNVNNSPYSSGSPSLVLNSSGNPCIAWQNFTFDNYDIYFARWNGASWINASGETLSVTNGNVSKNVNDSRDPSLVLDSSGNPCIAWTDKTPGKGDIYFVRWSNIPK